MALKNLKNYEPSTARNLGITTTDQVQIVTRAAVPTDADLANGRIVYVTGTGLRAYIGSTWVTIGAAGGGAITSFDEIYDLDPTLSVDTVTMTFAGATALATGDVVTITAAAAVSGDCLQFTNSGTGSDVKGTSSTWSVSKAGAAIFNASVTSTAFVCYGSGDNASLTIDAKGTGTITLGATSTGAITLTRATTITGAETTDAFTITAGDAVLSDGSLTMTDADEASTLTIVNNTAAAVNVVSVTADAIAAGGALLYLDSLAAGMSTGLFINCYDNAASAFSVGLYGATTIAGVAATNVFGITAGDATMSDGSLTIADADDAATLSVTSTAVFTQTTSGVVTIIANSATTGNIIDVNADGLTSGTILHLDSTTAGITTGLYIDCNDGAASEFSVGLDGATIITTSAAGTIGLTIASASTTGDAMRITATALTTGDALQIASTALTFAAGELLKITNTESGDTSATPKTGNLASITSSVTQTTASATLEYDTLLISRSNIMNQATFTLTASGSVLKLLNTSTNTAGTCTDTTVVLEVEAADGGTAAPTGDVVKVTSVGVGAKAINVVSASTSVSDVLITGSGVKATGKGVLEVTSSGATAAGGAVLKVGASGIPAAATSYLANFDYTGATCGTNNPIAVIIQGEGTGSPLLVTTTGAAADGVLQLVSTETGTTGVVLKTVHTSTASAANNDVVCSFQMWGLDDGNAVEEYGRIESKILTVTGGAEASAMQFYVTVNGTSETSLVLKTNYAIVGAGSDHGYVTSSGAYNLVLNTNEGTDSGTITITDAANGDITITPNGIGQTQLFAPTWQVTSKNAGATLTVAEGGVILATTGIGGITLVLPAAATSAGLWYAFKKVDADATALTIDANAAELIDGVATHTTCDAQYDTITICCTGSAWVIVSQKIA